MATIEEQSARQQLADAQRAQIEQKLDDAAKVFVHYIYLAMPHVAVDVPDMRAEIRGALADVVSAAMMEVSLMPPKPPPRF